MLAIDLTGILRWNLWFWDNRTQIDDAEASSSRRACDATKRKRMDQALEEDDTEASTSRPARDATKRKRMDQALEEEKRYDSDPAVKTKTKRKCKKKAHHDVNTDSEDDDFTSSPSTEDSDSEIEVLVSNDEVAESLPTKSLPAKSKRNPTSAAPPKKKHKKKDVEPLPNGNASAGPSNEPQVDDPPPKAKGKQKSTMRSGFNLWVKHQAIYYFYRRLAGTELPTNAVEGSRYYKSYFGNEEVVQMTQGSNYNTRKLQHHLKKVSLPHYRLYEVLQTHSGPATSSEIKLACGLEPMTTEIADEYQVELKNMSNNVKDMFTKQALEAQVPWSQEHFEDLVAKWVAACDQPFTAVLQDEFREMLQYVHHHSPTPLKIPSDDSVRHRIKKMGAEMVDGLKAIFKVRSQSIPCFWH
ncbi:hypothetical protein C8J57DRAFT_1231628 [Mycena rebaudengoi]|nr:hypothetical protein C8J57DRAFT_1231628 [Mycena rebaudengoi]